MPSGALREPSDDLSSVAATVHVDRCIETYIRRCRERIPSFVATHFSWRQTWDLQKPSLGLDLLRGPVNTAWSVPCVAIKRVCQTLDTLGVPGADGVLRLLSDGLRTGYERSVDTVVANDLLEWRASGEPHGLPQALVDALVEHPAVARAGVLTRPGTQVNAHAVLSRLSIARQLVTNSVSTFVTLALGWLLFGNTSLGITDLAERLARGRARSRAAAHFALGRPIGSVFYSVFRPEASLAETLSVLVMLAVFVAAIALAVSVASDPIRKQLGLHERRLHTLVDSLERELLVIAQNTIKPRVT